MMYEIKMKILFKVREIAWVLVSELENILYPYNNRLTPEEQYEHEMRDPITGEIEMVENLIQSQKSFQAEHFRLKSCLKLVIRWVTVSGYPLSIGLDSYCSIVFVEQYQC